MKKFLFGFVEQDFDWESGEAVDADGLGLVRGFFSSLPFVVLFWWMIFALFT